MAFNNSLAAIRKIGRNAVLPIDGIKTLCRKILAGKSLKTVLDFGSGTLFWADWFIQEFKVNVYAVDAYYDSVVMPEKDGIIYYSDLSACLSENADFSMVWACDVMHHLSPVASDNFLEEIHSKADIIIIKDIDANHRIGNFMNKVHDKIINGETVYNIYPDKISNFLKSRGFETFYQFMPKIWYPHFVLVAVRGKRAR